MVILCYCFWLFFIFNFISSHVYITAPVKLKEIFKEKTGRNELYSNFANFGRIPYGYTTVSILLIIRWGNYIGIQIERNKN